MHFFDEHGHLTPYSEARSSTEAIYDQFVHAFPTSLNRATLYHEWSKYNRLLRQIVGEDFDQWLNGSFVTKKLNPRDIDIVSFIPFHIYERQEAILDKFWSDTWESEGVDAYLVKVYPDYHVNFVTRTQPESGQWFSRYTSTKPDINFVSYQKGFLSITVS